MHTTFTITSEELTDSETKFLMAWLQEPKGSRPTKDFKTKRAPRPSTEEVQYITDQILKGRSNSQIANDVAAVHGGYSRCRERRLADLVRRDARLQPRPGSLMGPST